MTKRVGDYLAWLGGGDKAILEKIPQERARFAQMAGALLTTASFAVVSMVFALYNGVKVPLLPSIFFGLLWGIVILNLDRFLVLSMGTTRDRGRLALIALPRLLLALVLSLVIATPLVLRIFASDINAQLVTMQHEGFNKADTGILAQLQALSELSAHSSSTEAARLVLLTLFTLIGILPVVAKFLLNLGPLTLYETVAKLEEEKIIDRARIERTANRRNEERMSETRINVEDDMRKREEDLGKHANEYVASEMAKILDVALQEWSDQVRARLASSSESGIESQPTKGASPSASVQVNPDFLPPDKDKL